MKKALSLIVIGFLVLFGVSFLNPVPEVSPVQRESEPDEQAGNTENNQPSKTNRPPSGVQMKSGAFVFPYYKNPSDHEPSWVFRGTGGHIAPGPKRRVQVSDPNIIYFSNRTNGDSPSDRRIKRVRITGKKGEKRPGNIAYVRNQVFVRTDNGGRLKTRELHTNFKTNRIYTRSHNDVFLTRPGVTIRGTGFTGNSQLFRFTVRKNANVHLVTNRLLKPEQDQASSTQKAPLRGDRYYIHCDGPLNARMVKEDEQQRTWEISMYRNVNLFRVTANGTLRERSRELHLTLVERRRSTTSTRNDTSPETSDRPTKLRVKSITAVGQVFVTDPQLNIRSNHLTIDKQPEQDIIRMRGDQQWIQFHTARTPGDASAVNSVHPTRTQEPYMNVHVSGRGIIKRPRTERSPDAGNEPSSPSGSATFDGRVRVQKQNTKLYARHLDVQFQPTPAADETETTKQTRARNRPLNIQSLHASDHVLFLRDHLAADGDRLDWTIEDQIIKLRGSSGATATDLRNEIRGQILRINKPQHRLTARNRAHATLRMDSSRGFHLLGNSGLQNGSSSQRTERSTSRTPWHIEASSLTFEMNPETEQLQSLRATGDVQLSSEQGTGQGSTFTFHRDRSRAKLQGDEKPARLTQGKHRARADEFAFQLNRRTVVLHGRKKIRFHQPSGNKSSDQQNNPSGRKHPERVFIMTDAPSVVHRSAGILRVLGPSRVQRPAGWMRSRRMTLEFNPRKNTLKTVHASGNLFVFDRRGAARGNLGEWTPKTDRLQVRGQPYASLRQENRNVQYEIITIRNNWKRFRGEWYKWREPGEVRMRDR